MSSNSNKFLKAPPPGTVQVKAQVIQCPWHNNGYDGHPGGAPECDTMQENIAMGRVIPLAHLITWLSLIVTETGPLTSVLWLHHLVEWGTDDAKEQATEQLQEMGEIDAEG
jgi:hypothetical protein